MHEDEIEHIIDFGVKTGISNLAIIGENTEYSKTLIFTAKNLLFNKGIGLDIIVFEDNILNDRVKLRNKIKKLSGWKKEHKNKPCLKVDFASLKLSDESASAIKGVMAVEKPIPIDMAMNKKLFPKDTAANSAVPN